MAEYSRKELMEKFKAADAAGDTSSAQMFLDAFRSLEEQPSVAEEKTFGREAGIIARGAIPGVISGAGAAAGTVGGAALGTALLPGVGTVIGGIGGGLIGAFAPELLAGDKIRKGMDFLGLPKAQDEQERILQAASEGVAGAVTPIGAGKTILRAAAPKVVKMLTASPIEQAVVGGGSAAVTEATDSPLAGVASSLISPSLRFATSRLRESPLDMAKQIYQKEFKGIAPDSAEGLSARKQLFGDEGSEFKQLLENERLKATQSLPLDTDISAPVMTGQTAQAQAVANLVKQREGAATAAKNAAINLVPSGNIPKADVSVNARSAIEDLRDKTREIETGLWEPLNDPKITIATDKRGGFGQIINFFEKGTPGNKLAGIDPRLPLTKTEKKYISPILKDLKALGPEVSLRELQSFRSNVLDLARGSDGNQKRIYNSLADAILDGIDAGIKNPITGKNKVPFTPELQAQYELARDFTKEKNSKFSNKYLKTILGETAAGADSTTLGKILTGGSSKEKYNSLLDLLKPMETPKSPLGTSNSFLNNASANLESAYNQTRDVVLKNVDNYLESDLLDNLGLDQIGDPNKVNAWKLKYKNIFEANPQLKQKYGDVQKAQNTAYEAIRLRDEALTAAETQHAVSFFNVDATDPTKIKKAFDSAVKSTEKNSIVNILNSIPANDQAARNGIKKIAIDTIFDQGDKPHEYLKEFDTKLKQIFSSPQEQEFLKKVSETSELLERYKNAPKAERPEIEALLSSNGFLPVLLGKASAYGMYGVAGLGIAKTAAATGFVPLLVALGFGLGGGAPAGKALAKFAYGAKRDDVVNLLKKGFTDPQVAASLMKPKDKNLEKYIAPFAAGLRSAGLNEISKDREPAKYAAGGPVYTHPAISSIRAKRAVGRMAS